MRTQLDRMRRQLDYHLAHARAAASGAPLGARSSVAESADALARTLLRLHADRGLSIDVNVAPDHAVRVQREDLDEMLGNLLDNACKWARKASHELERLPVGRTVDLGRLQRLARLALQPGQQEQHHERRPLPDERGDDRQLRPAW